MAAAVAQTSVVECARCGKPVAAGAKFCPRCGSAQGAGPVTRALRDMGRPRLRLGPLGQRLVGVGVVGGTIVSGVLATAVVARVKPPQAPPQVSTPPAAAAAVAEPGSPPGPSATDESRALPAAVISQLPMRWRHNGRWVDCTIRNESTWRVDGVEIELTVRSKHRPVRTESCTFTAAIAPGETVTLDLPFAIDLDPRQSFDCRVIGASGFAAAAP